MMVRYDCAAVIISATFLKGAGPPAYGKSRFLTLGLSIVIADAMISCAAKVRKPSFRQIQILRGSVRIRSFISEQ